MNNAFIIQEDTLSQDSVKDATPELRARTEVLTDIIEALSNISGSSYWKVLSKNVFDVELAKSKRRLEVESNTTEIFRLQGEVRIGRKYDLNELITKYRDELQTIRKKINE